MFILKRQSGPSNVARKTGTYLHSVWETVTPPGEDTNPPQVSPRQMLVLRAQQPGLEQV